MYIDGNITDGAVITGTVALKSGTVLEKDGDNYKKLEVAANADAILMQDVTPTVDGVVSVISLGGIVQFIKEDEFYLPVGITLKDIKPYLRILGLYIRGVN